METIKRTVVISEDHKIGLTLPKHIPTGEAEIVMVIASRSPLSADRKQLLELIGCLSDSERFGKGKDPMAIQRQLRNEWN